MSVPCPPEDTVAMQWHKRILSDFSLGFEDRTASSYQECISRASVRKWIGISPLKDSSDREGKKKENTNRLPSIPMGDFLGGESF